MRPHIPEHSHLLIVTVRTWNITMKKEDSIYCTHRARVDALVCRFAYTHTQLNLVTSLSLPDQDISLVTSLSLPDQDISLAVAVPWWRPAPNRILTPVTDTRDFRLHRNISPKRTSKLKFREHPTSIAPSTFSHFHLLPDTNVAVWKSNTGEKLRLWPLGYGAIPSFSKETTASFFKVKTHLLFPYVFHPAWCTIHD
jgi:hypothetical protein